MHIQSAHQQQKEQQTHREHQMRYKMQGCVPVYMQKTQLLRVAESHARRLAEARLTRGMQQ